MEWLFNFIYRKRLDKFQRIVAQYRQEQRNLKMEYKDKLKQYELVDRIFELLPCPYIIGKSHNKLGEELFIVIDMTQKSLYLFSQKYRGLLQLPRILFEIRLNKESHEKYLHIVDVLMEDNCIGNGSVAMAALIDYSKSIGIKYINGYLSNVDDNHADRREHFYKKFNFKFNGRTIKREL